MLERAYAIGRSRGEDKVSLNKRDIFYWLEMNVMNDE